MALDLSSLKKAVLSLQSSLEYSKGKISSGEHLDVEGSILRAGVIQNFEFTFELCWKSMVRWIEINRTPADSSPISKKEIFRIVAREKLIDNPIDWFKFLEARNISSHTYDNEKAERVYKIIVDFLPSAKKFLSTLERAND